MALLIAEHEEALADRVAERVAAAVEATLRSRPQALVCLTGGGTARRPYERLAAEPWRDRIVWDRLHLYWGDERHVPPDHRDSNYGMARDALVMHVPIPAAQVHRIRGELAPDEAAKLYARELPDRFDLLLLGLGEDGHIASIFPGSPVVAERERRAVAVWAAHLRAYRITVTPPVILSAARILVMVAGAAKAAAVATAIEGPLDTARCPAHLLREAGPRVEWIIDRAAARALAAPRG